MTTRTVLFVDDDAGLLELVALTLDMESGLKVKTTRDASSALDYIRVEKPDLIFLDLRMPRIDGVKLCQMIKEDPALSRTKVIVLSALRAEEVAENAARAGADGFLVKPFSPRKLVSLVAELLPQREAAGCA